MFLNMIDKEPHIRAYIAPIRGLPLKAQQRMAIDAGIPTKLTYVKGQDGKRGMARTLWINSLREDDHAWVASILVLVQPKEDRGEDAPGADFAAALAEICRRRAILVDAKYKIKSTDTDWPNHVKWAMGQLAAVHRSQAGMRRAARAASEMRDQGLVTIWRAKPADEYDRVGAIWRDPLYNEMQAIARLPDDLKVVSPATIRRIFGPRKPGDPKAGGRPRKQPR